jgi:hypothetical protein
LLFELSANGLAFLALATVHLFRGIHTRMGRRRNDTNIKGSHAAREGCGG